ncbi:MAG: hypothetical protein V3U80_00560 [Flavobacteriaceae bacterium]
MNFKIHKKQLLYFIGSFTLFTIIGTVSHEYGHILAAKSVGYETTLHYGSMSSKPKGKSELYELYQTYRKEIDTNVVFPDESRYKELRKKANSNSLLITFGGPLQTMLTGILGLLILFIRKKKVAVSGFKLTDWFAVFLALFWMREVFNLAMGLASGIIKGNGNYFGTQGDEVNLSRHLNLYEGAIPLLFGSIGLLISLYVIFKIIPLKFRFTFIIAGLIGGISGFVLWFYYLGPIVLP